MPDKIQDGDSIRDKLMGLGNRSLRKSYYPELQKRIEELEKAHRELKSYKRCLEELVEERTNELKTANDRLQREIVEREALEARLVQAQKMEAIGTLAGGIAHDFNNILAAIMGYTELTQHCVGEEEARRYVGEILKACDRARSLISQILTFSRKSECEMRLLDMGRLVEDSLELLRATLPSTIDIRTEISPEACTVLGDPTRMHQVLINLCANAAHAMRERGGILDIALENITLPHGTLSVHGELAPGSYVMLSVSDTGTGMAPSVVSQIFDPFFTTKERGSGTGLGLSVVYGIVKDRGGTVSVESKQGKGSVFRVYLPAVPGRIEGTGESLEAAYRGSERILFVDDEETLVEMAHEMLKNLGYEVIAERGSLDALNLFLDQPDRFDLIITDMTMPRMTGLDFARQALGVRPDIPVILCTGYSELITERSAKSLGIRELIKKPFTLADLSGAVRRVLDGRTERKRPRML